jgi:hypothetical protein
LNFTFFRGIVHTKVAPVYVIGATFLQCAIGCCQLFGKFVTGGKWVLATLWQICYIVSEVISNLLKILSEGIVLATFANSKNFPEGCQYRVPSNPWLEAIDYPAGQLSEGKG